MNAIFHKSIIPESTSARSGVVGDMADVRTILMRQFTWLVLFSYTLLLIKPVMPIIEDTLAHTFWEKQHMLTVHEVNGKFHVHYEMARESKQSEKQKQTISNKFEVAEYLPVKTSAPVVCTQCFTRQPEYSLFQSYRPISGAGKDYPPPKSHSAAFSSLRLRMMG